MDNTLSNSFILTASFDGKTYYSQIVPLPGTSGFLQFLDKDTGEPSPSWKDNGPEFYQRISDTDAGDPVPESMPRLFWNGQEVTFNTDSSSADYGKSNGTWMAGCFKCTKKAVKNATGDGTTDRWVFQIINDIFGSGNVDSDDFYCVSTIKDASGNPVNIQSEPQKVECIQTVSGSTVHVDIQGNAITKGEVSTDLVATVYNSDGSKNETAGSWYKVVSSGDGTTKNVALVSGTGGYSISNNSRQLTVPRDDVNGVALYLFAVTVDGKPYYGYCSVADLNDPYHAEYIESHSAAQFTYRNIRKGDSVTYTGHVVDNDGKEARKLDGSAYAIAFYTRSKNGDPVVSGKDSFTVSWDDVVKTYQGQLSGYITIK